MKKYIYLMVLIISTMSNAQQNKFHQFYNDFENQEGITTIKINKAMFSFLGNMDLDEDLKKMTPLFKKMNSIQMIIYDGQKNTKIKEKLISDFKNLKLEELMTINNEGNRVRFYADQASSDIFNNLMLNISTSDELLYIILDGEIKAEDLNNMISSKE
ncbi:MAG TPA: DUF4252 domain-containing protein [Faecalibacter sp.]